MNSPATGSIEKRETGTLESFRLMRRWWLPALALFIAIQSGWLLHDGLGIRAVVYNKGTAPLDSVLLSCGGKQVSIGEIDLEDSRYEWFRAKQTTVVSLSWWVAGVQHEGAWSGEPGELITLRVGEDATVVMSRERSIILKLRDLVAGE